MSGVCRRITMVEYTLHAILWVPWKAKFMRLSSGDNYLFSFPSFPSSQFIKTLITHSTRIELKPEEEKRIYAEVTDGKQWVEPEFRWCQLSQVAMWKNSVIIITEVSIILFSSHFYIYWMHCACGTLWTKSDVKCSKKISAKGKHMYVMAKDYRDPT